MSCFILTPHLSATYYQLQIRNSIEDPDSKNHTLDDFVYEAATRFHSANVARVVSASAIQHAAILVCNDVPYHTVAILIKPSSVASHLNTPTSLVLQNLRMMMMTLF